MPFPMFDLLPGWMLGFCLLLLMVGTIWLFTPRARKPVTVAAAVVTKRAHVGLAAASATFEVQVRTGAGAEYWVAVPAVAYPDYHPGDAVRVTGTRAGFPLRKFVASSLAK